MKTCLPFYQWRWWIVLPVLQCCAAPPPPASRAVPRISAQAPAESAGASSLSREADPAEDAEITPPDLKGTVLEQLQAARRELERKSQRVAQLEAQGAQLSQTVEQLRRDNQALQELADSFETTRHSTQEQMTNLEAKVRELERELRDQIDQVLVERIQRVRVERELILSKIAEAEVVNDG